LKRKKSQEDNLHSGGNLPNCKRALKICYLTMKALPCFEVPRHEGGSPSDGLFLLEKFKFSSEKN